MRRLLSIVFVLVADIALMVHVLVPHHHHGEATVVLHTLSHETHHTAEAGECPLAEAGATSPESCFIAEADLFLARSYQTLTDDILQALYITDPIGQIEVPTVYSSILYKRQDSCFVSKTIALPFGLRAPPVC